jgi:hypothetical protein
MGRFVDVTMRERLSTFDWAVVVLSVLTALSALAMAGLNLAAAPAPFFLAFESLTLLSAGFGIALGLNRFPVGRSLGLLCVAGAIGLSAILGFESAGRQISGRSLAPLLLSRVTIATLFAMASAYLVLRRRPHESFASLAKGLAALVLCAIASYALRKYAGAIAGLHPVAAVLAFLLLGAFILSTLAAGVHYTIRAFEFGQLSLSVRPKPADTTTPSNSTVVSH